MESEEKVELNENKEAKKTKKEKKEKTKKKKVDVRELFTKIMAGFLALLMVLAVMTTFLYYIFQ